MRCSRCDMPLSPNRKSCPRCGAAVTWDGAKGQGERPFASVQVQSEYRPNSSFAHGPDCVGTPVDIAPTQQHWHQYEQEVPFATALVPPTTPSASPSEGFQTPSHVLDVQELSPTPPLPKRNKHSVGMGFGLAGLCTGIACLLLLFVYIMAQTLPQLPGDVSARSDGGLSPLTAQNTPAINPSPTVTVSTASPTPTTYPGQQYFANAQTANAVNITTAQAIVPATTFKVGQKIYVTFDVHPNGQTGAVCLLWFINGAQLTSYPFALKTTDTTSAYSYAATGFAGAGYIEMYWENAPSCTDPNKILGDHINFTVTA